MGDVQDGVAQLSEQRDAVQQDATDLLAAVAAVDAQQAEGTTATTTTTTAP